MVKFLVRELDSWFNEEEGWWVNNCYNIGEFKTKAKNERKAFTAFLRRNGIIFKKNRTRIEFDGDNYTIVDRKTGEPLYDAIFIESFR